MNRSSSAEAFLISSMMSFVGGLDSATVLKQHHAATPTSWDNWDAAAAAASASSHNQAAIAAAALQNHSFFMNAAPAMDCPSPLLPIGNFPLYPPPPPPPLPPQPATQQEYLPLAAGIVKRDHLQHFGGGGRIGLNLGHRTYFSPGDALAIDRLLGRARLGSMYSLGGGGGGHGLHHQPPRCQAEGCRANLSGAKHYHRRHKVCEFHSKASVTVVAGLHQRFCQQCSRFHVLAEFDESKRSCRKRLADHNRRRRKPQVVLPAADAAPAAAAAPADRSSSVSVSKNTNSNSDKRKQLQKTTNKVSAKSTVCSTNVATNRQGVQQHQYPNNNNNGSNNGNRNGPALSLGAVVAAENDSSGRGNGNGGDFVSGSYAAYQGTFPAVDKEIIKPLSPSPPLQQQNLQSYYVFSKAAGHGDPAAGHLHLGQFEVDYM